MDAYEMHMPQSVFQGTTTSHRQRSTMHKESSDKNGRCKADGHTELLQDTNHTSEPNRMSVPSSGVGDAVDIYIYIHIRITRLTNEQPNNPEKISIHWQDEVSKSSQ